MLSLHGKNLSSIKKREAHSKKSNAFYISFSDLTVSGKNIVPTESKSEPGALLMMVGPFSEQRFSLPVGAGSIVEWSVITDYGSSSGKRQQKL